MQLSAPAEVFKDVFSAAYAVNDDCIMRLYDDGIRTNMVDPANVFMIMASLNARDFTEYEQGEEEKVAIDLSELMSKLKSTKKGDDIYMDLSGPTLNLSYGRYNYSFRVLAPSQIQEGPQLHAMVYDSVFVIDGKEFSSAIKALSGEAKELVVETTPDAVVIKANDGTNKANVIFERGDSCLDIKESIDTRCVLSTEYLELMGKAVSKCKEVLIQTSSTMPFRVSADIGNSSITMILAPRTGGDA